MAQVEHLLSTGLNPAKGGMINADEAIVFNGQVGSNASTGYMDSMSVYNFKNKEVRRYSAPTNQFYFGDYIISGERVYFMSYRYVSGNKTKINFTNKFREVTASSEKNGYLPRLIGGGLLNNKFYYSDGYGSAISYWDHSDNTFSEGGFNKSGIPIVFNGSLYVITWGSVNRVDPDDGTMLEEIVSFGSIPSTPRPITQRGSKIYIAGSNSVLTIDLVVKSSRLANYTPNNIPSIYGGNTLTEGNRGLWPASDGYLYGLSSNEDLLVVNPNTGQWATIELDTNLAGRYLALFSDNKIWIPSSEPNDWN